MRLVDAVVKIPRMASAFLASPHPGGLKCFLTAKNCTPARCKAQLTIVSLGCYSGDPMIHATFGRICGDEFSEGYTDKGLEDENKDEPVDN